MAANLHKDSRFAYAGVASEQNERALDDAAAKNPVKLFKSGKIPLLILCCYP